MNKFVENKDYFEYLQKRSMLGVLYHNYFLYPRLSHVLHGKVLDFGCGIGEFLKFRSNTIGVDVNEFNIEHCKTLGLKAELLDEAGGIPFENNSFSGVVIDNVIEHILAREIDQVIDEIIRVLIPNGTIVVGVPGIKGYYSDPDHKVFYTEDNLVALFDRHGWVARRSFRVPLSWHFLERYMNQYCVYVVFHAR